MTIRSFCRVLIQTNTTLKALSFRMHPKYFTKHIGPFLEQNRNLVSLSLFPSKEYDYDEMTRYLSCNKTLKIFNCKAIHQLCKSNYKDLSTDSDEDDEDDDT